MSLRIVSSLVIFVFTSFVGVGAQSPAVAPTSPGAQARGQAPAPNFKKLTRAELDALLQNPAGLLILDVRRPDELQTIGGFPVYLSIQSSQLANSIGFIPKDRAIVTVSNHAARAGRAAELLEKNGFKVAGGIGAQDYEAEGGTLVKIVPPPPGSRSGGTAAPPAGSSLAGSSATAPAQSAQ